MDSRTSNIDQFALACFCKPDLDTVLAAWLLCGNDCGKLLALHGEAPAQFLANRRILCLECGGSGQTEANNFDHHGAELLPCAAEQAWLRTGADSATGDLVTYVSCVDTGKDLPYPLPDGALPLSALFSGMLSHTSGKCRQFRAGLRIFQAMRELGLHPADVRGLPDVYQWARDYAHARDRARQGLADAAADASFVMACGVRVGLLVTPWPGVHGLLRKMGAEISIAGCPNGQTGKVRWSVSACKGLEDTVQRLLVALARVEAGWGGPCGGGIIGSPRQGSRLAAGELLQLVTGHCA